MSEEDLEIYFKGKKISFHTMFKVVDPETLDGLFEIINCEQSYRKGYSKELFHLKFPNRKEFFECQEWGLRRIELLKQSKYTCQFCGKTPCNIVYHKNDPFSMPELCLACENLMVLCKDCSLILSFKLKILKNYRQSLSNRA